MTKTTRAVMTLIGAVLLISLACTCGAVSTGLTADTPAPPEPSPTPGGQAEPTQETGGVPTQEPTAGGGNFDTEFPIPDDAQNFTNVAGNVNYQTGMSLADVLAYYRDAFTGQGYTERELLTVISDTTFSIVFDGHPSGNAIVVQAVDLGNNSTNVNLRLEAVP